MLAQAKAYISPKEGTVLDVSDEMLELALAFCKHEVSGRQVEVALKLKSGCAQTKMFTVIKSAIRGGRLVTK